MHRFDEKNQPRPIQLEALEYLRQNWDRAEVFGICAPTATGKSAIARALQVEHGGSILSISNVLVNQYADSYPEVTCLKGGQNYPCKKVKDVSCADMKEIRGESCTGCPYRKAREEFVEGAPVIANPASFYYNSLDPQFTTPELVIIDEAHNLIDFVTGFADDIFPVGVDGCPRTTNIIELANWAYKAYDKFSKEAEQMPKQTAKANRYKRVWLNLTEEPETISLLIEDRLYRRKMTTCVRVCQLRPKTSVVKRFHGKKTVLLSATLMRSDVTEFAMGARSLYTELESPIPMKNRMVKIDHIPTQSGTKTPPQDVASWVRKWQAQVKGPTIVHVTYAYSKLLAPYFPEAIVNTAENKMKCIEEFKEKGGLFIASGCAEGIDLKDDLCRLNLIPVLYRANIGDSGVQKRLNQPGGSTRYNLDTIRTTIQQCGRSTRTPTDYSTIVVGDIQLQALLQRHKKDVPESFLRSVTK